MRMDIFDSELLEAPDTSDAFDKDYLHEQMSDAEETIHVLVIEDDDFDFRITKKALLELDSYRVKVDRATSVQEAKSAALYRSYHVVLVDFCLGLDTGVLALGAFGGRDSHSALILLTGMPGQDVQKIALKAGALHCINKNQLNAVLLEATIRSALHTHRLEKELQKTIQNLEQANKEKNAIYANMGHDLKTPLNAILGYAELISDNSMPNIPHEKYQDFATKIRTGGLHLLEVINNLILHSGDDVDRIGGEFQCVDINGLTTRAVELIQILAQNKNISIAFEPDTTPVTVRCQPSMISQSIVNLLSNAVKYTPENGHISVSVYARNDLCHVEIRDDGIGMSDEEIAIALETFGRVRLPAQLSQEGTGLGLPIVDKIVSSHGGVLKLKSQPGEGTCVVITLPCLEAQS